MIITSTILQLYKELAKNCLLLINKFPFVILHDSAAKHLPCLMPVTRPHTMLTFANEFSVYGNLKCNSDKRIKGR